MKNKHLNMKKIIGIAYLCIALASSVYAVNAAYGTTATFDQCYHADTNPVTFLNPDGTN